MKKECIFFVVFHDRLKDKYYHESLVPEYKFVNVNPGNNLSSLNKDYQVINQYEFNNFYPLGKWYTESEVIYNIYKNSYLYEELDYIGFLQHDIDSEKLTSGVVENLLSNCQHVNFQPYLFDSDYDQKILMDVDQPNKKLGIGVNCYDVIINDYNKFYGKNYKKSDLENKTINLCSSFILKKEVFIEMMVFIASIIESKKLDQFDTDRLYRIQGGYLERYYAVWLSFRALTVKEYNLEHHFIETKAERSLANRILQKIGFRK